MAKVHWTAAYRGRCTLFVLLNSSQQSSERDEEEYTNLERGTVQARVISGELHRRQTRVGVYIEAKRASLASVGGTLICACLPGAEGLPDGSCSAVLQGIRPLMMANEDPDSPAPQTPMAESTDTRRKGIGLIETRQSSLPETRVILANPYQQCNECSPTCKGAIYPMAECCPRRNIRWIDIVHEAQVGKAHGRY